MTPRARSSPCAFRAIREWALGVPVVMQHDAGCRFAREADGGHSDAARRLADKYNLHRTAGARPGQWFAVALADGTSGDHDTLYDTKGQAVFHQHHNEWNYAFIMIGPPSMSICAAASVMRWQRQQAALKLPDRDDPRGGMDVIPRLTQEGQRRQLAALAGRLRLPVALGHRRT